MNNSLNLTAEQEDYILSAEAIRPRCQKIYEYTLEGKTHFELQEQNWDKVVELVLSITQKNYPTGAIPYHSRWNHLACVPENALPQYLERLNSLPLPKRLASEFDLAIVSVLLDAGAGDKWKFHYKGKTFSRSEGLAVASWDMFNEGLFSSSEIAHQVDSTGLLMLTQEQLEQAFQAAPDNPLVGVSGRHQLLLNLGHLLQQNPAVFGSDGHLGKLSNLLSKDRIDAKQVLKVVLQNLGELWPGRLRGPRFNLGDVWSHSLLGEQNSFNSLVPFHKLSQWLSYSLIESLERNGVQVDELDQLTGLPEYRNGGLFLDTKLLTVKDPQNLQKEHAVDSDFIIEWRALTVILLDQLADKVRVKLNKNKQELPLARVLEGGTWSAGRSLAADLRGGLPPVHIISDGTVF